MCLLVFAWQTDPDCPLVVAANRDERLDRPAHSLCVLQKENPRILGGRDDLAGGTWLAVNEHGVVAGLTNRPSPGGRDPTKRSRGELPLMLASQRSAEAGVAELVRRVQTGQYNPAWLLVGDRESLYYLELASDLPLLVRQLSPGIHVLENVGLGEPSLKVDRVWALLSMADSANSRSLWTALPSVLADHTIPLAPEVGQRENDAVVRRPDTLAACVHTEDYGTRSAALVRVSSDPGTRPEMLVADGPSCTTQFIDVTTHWADDEKERKAGFGGGN
ncbi:MAG: NRDE family protein [Acidimicrobiales bacterium]